MTDIMRAGGVGQQDGYFGVGDALSLLSADCPGWLAPLKKVSFAVVIGAFVLSSGREIGSEPQANQEATTKLSTKATISN